MTVGYSKINMNYTFAIPTVQPCVFSELPVGSESDGV